jgi:hypothetical protein
MVFDEVIFEELTFPQKLYVFNLTEQKQFFMGEGGRGVILQYCLSEA